jgi:predicted  nucleic acid-binding Zn-ribbon protein
MEFELDGHIRRVMERLLQEVEEMGRRQEALEAMVKHVIAEQAELRRRQDDLMREWEDFGKRLNAYSAAWETHLNAQMKQLEGFAQELGNSARQLSALLPPEASPEEY